MATTSTIPEAIPALRATGAKRRPFALYVFILLAIGVAVGVASRLFAGASAGAFDAKAINTGDTAWVLSSAALVMLYVAGNVSMAGRGNNNRPPFCRYDASRRMISLRKCHGSTSR